MTSENLIFILEDSLEIQQLLSNSLKEAGYSVQSFGRALEFEKAFAQKRPDLCIIDLGLPDKDGLGIIGAITAQSDAAILVISGRSKLSDKIAGLELGADDYLSKPFEMSEVIARVRALLRRKAPSEQPREEGVVNFSGRSVDLGKFILTDEQGHQERLTASEVSLLRVFIHHPNRLITRDKLREELGDKSDDLSFDRAIDVRVSRLRAKLKDSSKDPKVIKTIYGAGYILVTDMP